MLRLRLAQAALIWERFWPRFWPTLGVTALFVAVALYDVLPRLPAWLHGLILGLFVIALAAALWHASGGIAWPGTDRARRRLELASGLAHRPLAALDDRLASDGSDRASAALWDAHRQRLLTQVARLKVGWPHPGLAKVDPFALRCAVTLLLLVAVATGWDDWRGRLEAAVRPPFGATTAGMPTRFDVWINPPAYTALPPLFLGPEIAGEGAIEVPTGSTVLAQVQGQDLVPQLRFGGLVEAFSQVTAGVHKISSRLEAGDLLTITQGEETLAEWPIRILPDTAPSIEFLSPPGRTERSALRLDYRAADDYGLTSVEAVIRRADQPEAEPLRLELVLPAGEPRESENASYHDLTPHHWAGLAVDISLVATDALGQTGESDAARTVLPERIFNHPVARALVELRKKLTLEPEKRFPVVRALAQLSRHPEHFFHDIVVALTLRSAERRLLYDRSDKAVLQVQRLMWDTALRIEEGELAIAEQDLREIQEALMKALAEGASEEEIERLMQELREALDRFLAAMAEQLAEQMAEGMEPQALPPDAQLLQSEDLRQMLEQARELARSGARDAARDMLARLQEMLENLRANPLAQMMEQDGESAWEMMRQMEEMMQQQQELLDRSYERAQQGEQQGGQSGEQQGEGQQQGQGRGGQPGDGQMDALSQEELRRRLGEMMRQLGDALGDIPRPLGRAEQAMRDARDALSRDRPGEAINPQSRALDQLQQGMQAMADRFMERMGQSQPQRGGGQVGMEPGYGRDPLGRNTGETGLEALEGVEIPDQMELRRAREILNELRRRRSETKRPTIELDYLDRLLQQF